MRRIKRWRGKGRRAEEENRMKTELTRVMHKYQLPIRNVIISYCKNVLIKTTKRNTVY